MQRYDHFLGVVCDCWGWGAITCDGVRLWGLRGPDPVEDGLHLAGCEDLAGGFVAGREEFVAEHVVAMDHLHEVVDGDAWGAVRKVHQGEFFLAVCAGFWFHIHSFFC